ncbi:translocase [Histidinibacterium aquaticum]|uniref:Translocase n=1 Tax=Histidinibacterium aquaticum TaxID=2613962 RepID=A0A5J5GFB2_9RHOB|nr:translocase [Histidinibacterium aquaticum]KAA9006919.1 translocase [Histidinibacterium aquaticum]
MSKLRKIAIAGGTFGVALSIGFVMQNEDVMAARFGTDIPELEGGVYDEPILPPPGPDALANGPVPQQQTPPASEDLAGSPMPEGAPAQTADAAPEAEQEGPGPAIVFHQAPERAEEDTAEAAPVVLAAAPAIDASLLPARDVVTLAAAFENDQPRVPASPRGLTAPDGQISRASAPSDPENGACRTTLTAEPAEAAMVDLTLESPCMAEEQATIHHQGMLFTMLTDEAGTARASVPALSEAAVFIASFESGDGAVATARVPSLPDFDRAVLQWEGETGLQLHAREFGAAYGSEGHVWQAAARGPEVAATGEGGFLVRLGDGAGVSPLFAEVYTFPTAASPVSGDIFLSVEAEITEESCGEEIAAQSIQVKADGAADALDLTLAMPGCDAVGEFLVLKNMLADLTLAAR